MLFMPESPRYLVETEKYDEAMRILKRLHYDGTNDDWIQTEYTEIKATIDAEKAVMAPGWQQGLNPRSLCLSMCTLHPEPGLRLKMCMFSAHVHLDLGHLGLAESFSQH